MSLPDKGRNELRMYLVNILILAKEIQHLQVCDQKPMMGSEDKFRTLREP